MKQDNKSQKKQGTHKKVKLFKARKKKSVEEDAAIQYLQAQYEKVFHLHSFKYHQINHIMYHA